MLSGEGPMHKEPATWSSRDRVLYYRTDAARFHKMAEAESRAAIRERLVVMSRHYGGVANTLENRTMAAA
jgi:hypothetical protein